MPKTQTHMLSFRGGPHDGFRCARSGTPPSVLYCVRRPLEDYSAWVATAMPAYGLARYELLTVALYKDTCEYAGLAKYRYAGIEA